MLNKELKANDTRFTYQERRRDRKAGFPFSAVHKPRYNKVLVLSRRRKSDCGCSSSSDTSSDDASSVVTSDTPSVTSSYASYASSETSYNASSNISYDAGDDVFLYATDENRPTCIIGASVAPASTSIQPSPCGNGVNQPGIVVFKQDWSVSYNPKPCACTLERESRHAESIHEQEVVDPATFWGRLKH